MDQETSNVGTKWEINGLKFPPQPTEGRRSQSGCKGFVHFDVSIFEVDVEALVLRVGGFK